MHLCVLTSTTSSRRTHSRKSMMLMMAKTWRAAHWCKWEWICWKRLQPHRTSKDCLDAFRLRQRHGLFPFTSGLPRVKGKNNSQMSHESSFGFPTSHKWQSHEWQVGNPNGPWVTSLGIIPVTSPQPRGIIIPIVSENLPFKVKRKALAMPSGQKKGIGNAFGSKWQAFAMIFAQKEGIANAFRSKWRHGKFPLPNLISKFSLAI